MQKKLKNGPKMPKGPRGEKRPADVSLRRHSSRNALETHLNEAKTARDLMVKAGGQATAFGMGNIGGALENSGRSQAWRVTRIYACRDSEDNRR